MITRVDDWPVASAIDFNLTLVGHKRGDVLKVGFQRGGAEKEITLTLGGRPKPDGAMLLSQRFGFTASVLNERDARAIGLRRVEGLMVEAVEANGPATRIGLRKGDVIDHLAGLPAGNLDEVGTVLERTGPGTNVAISVLRVQGRTLYRTQTALTTR